jgi:hypothetical protein
MQDQGAVLLTEFMGGAMPAVGPTWTQQEKDRAKRAADIINEARQTLDWDELRTCWIAIRLSDGSSDRVLYDCKRDAVRHQLHEQQCAYVSFKNLIGGVSANDMLRFLRFTTKAYDAGMRLPDPDDPFGGPDLAPTAAHIDSITGHRRQVKR